MIDKELQLVEHATACQSCVSVSIPLKSLWMCLIWIAMISMFSLLQVQLDATENVNAEDS